MPRGAVPASSANFLELRATWQRAADSYSAAVAAGTPPLKAADEATDALMQLPRIGPTVKWHLARNLGVVTSMVKPDVHLVRYAESVDAGLDRRTRRRHTVTPQTVVRSIAAHPPNAATALGTIDFVLWAWLMHDRGESRFPCCDGLRIR